MISGNSLEKFSANVQQPYDPHFTKFYPKAYGQLATKGKHNYVSTRFGI